MSTQAPLLGRPADRKNLIVKDLRRRITEGELAPGEQLPTRHEISLHFGASPVTVQSALEHLRRDGFITVSGRQGTYVSERPPHLANYALVFPAPPTHAHEWVRFWTALGNEAVSLRTAEGGRIQMYYGVDNHMDSDDAKRLLDDVLNHRLGGLIFTSPQRLVLESPLFTEPGIPRVIISGGNYDINVPRVGTNQESFWLRAGEYLASRGRFKVAVIGQDLVLRQADSIRGLLERSGLRVRPHWLQGVHLGAPGLARNLAHLLLHRGHEELPDGLIIADDNLVEHAAGGLVEAGIEVPRELEIVAHCNYPWPTPSVLAVQRLGYDSRAILETCLQAIADLREGREVPALQTVEARLDNEIGVLNK